MFSISNRVRWFLIIIIVIIVIDLIGVEGRKCVCTSKVCKEAKKTTCETKYFCYTELIPISDRKIGENTTTRGCTQSPTPLLCETKSWITRSKLLPLLSSPSSFSTDNDDKIEEDSIENRNSLLSTISWIRMSWPRLKCCDNKDYCNADYLDDLPKWIQVIEENKEKKINEIEEEEEEEEEVEEEKEEEEKEGEFFIKKKMNRNNNATYHSTETSQPNGLQSSGRISLYNNLQSIDSDGRSTNTSGRDHTDISFSSNSLTMVNESTDRNEELFLRQIRPLHIAAVILAISALISVFAACYVITRLLKSHTYMNGNTYITDTTE